MIDVLTNALATKNIELSDIQKQQFQKYYELLIEWNNKMNLTAITAVSYTHLTLPTILRE